MNHDLDNQPDIGKFKQLDPGFAGHIERVLDCLDVLNLTLQGFSDFNDFVPVLTRQLFADLFDRAHGLLQILFRALQRLDGRLFGEGDLGFGFTDRVYVHAQILNNDVAK